jgi:hypothetical protein
LLKNRAFVIRVQGDVTLGAGTFSVLLNKGTALTGTLLASSGALTPAASGSFLLEFYGSCDPTSDVLMGVVRGHVGGTVIVNAVGANAAWDPAIENTLFVSFDWGTSNANNRTALRNLDVDVL